MNTSSAHSALWETALVRSPMLSPADREALIQIAAEPRPFKAGVDLIVEGGRTDTIFIIPRGWACRYKITRQGARQITGIVVPGDVCNLDSFMLPQVNYAVRTMTPGVAIGLPRERVQALAADSPAIARAFTWLTIVENAILSEWALSLGRKTAHERLAHLFCEFAVRLGCAKGDRASYDMPITQEHIADALGLTAVHVNRMIQQLRREGLLVTQSRRVTLPNMAALRRIASFDEGYLQADEPGDVEATTTAPWLRGSTTHARGVQSYNVQA